MVRASIERVFAALTDPALFPTWGPVSVEGKIAPGERPVFDFGPGGKTTVYVVAIEPPSYFAYRWMQGETDPAALLGDPLARPNTLVEFRLEQIADTTRVRVIESGISALPSVPGVDIGTAIEHMGEGWKLMLGGLARSFASADLVAGDRIESELALAAAREQVYAALIHPETWWAQRVEGSIAPGERPTLDFGPFGRIQIDVLATDAPSRLVFRWIQSEDAALRAEDPRLHPATQVELQLADAPGGTRLQLVEHGFDALPGDRAALWKRAHQAWGIILGMLEGHLAKR